MEEYTIYCTPEQTKKALELGAPIEKDWIPEFLFNNEYFSLKNPTAEQMIGFILYSGRGYAIDLAELIKEYGYKQGCLTFINLSLL